MKKIGFLVIMIAFAVNMQAQNDDTDTQTSSTTLQEDVAKQDIIKKGISFGPLPIIAFDQDKGLQYGGLLNIFDFGDGSNYPHPRQQWYIESSWFTKGTQQYFLTYDTRTLIPNVRMSLATTVMLDKAMDFYGFNGYQSIYQADSVNHWRDKKNKEGMPAEYMSAFYRLDRQNVTLKADFVGKLPVKNLFWQGSYYLGSYKYSPIHRDKINKGKPIEEQFPEGEQTLYEKYIDWGIIPEDEKDGGFASALRGGLMYDSRDFEAAPSSGIWAEANLTLAPSFLGTTHAYNRYMLIFRHYVPMADKKLVLAYRLNYQGTIGNYLPYYIIPAFSTIGREYDRDGIGGYRTVRGIMRDRVQGLDMAFFNAEMRWKFLPFHVKKQNVYLGMNAFLDGGMVTRDYDISYRGNEDFSLVKPEYEKYIDLSKSDALHLAAGGGFRIIINRNFIIAVDYAMPFDKQDGKGSLYINTGYLF
ncbi:MAG: BamA/TamA family outer membrane protein [Bacteroidales bacterium]|nr:BamA/TamA family outer membrane protein [Bacteroidales bacterium]